VVGILEMSDVVPQGPFVLNVDNGFVSADVCDWVRRSRTQLLYSPAACPRFNGSIEASGDAMTTRTHEAAAAAGYPEYWTTEDLETAPARKCRGAQIRPRATTGRALSGRDALTAAKRVFLKNWRDATRMSALCGVLKGCIPYEGLLRRRAVVRS
jgi:hypothetical protein